MHNDGKFLWQHDGRLFWFWSDLWTGDLDCALKFFNFRQYPFLAGNQSQETLTHSIIGARI